MPTPTLPARGPAPAPADDPLRASHARLAARYGTTGLAPYLTSAGLQVVELAGGFGAAGYFRHGRWALTVGDVIAPPALHDAARSEYLDLLAAQRLRPALLAVADPAPYRRRGFAVQPVAAEAVVDLPGFELSGDRRAGLRAAVATAAGAGYAVLPQPADGHPAAPVPDADWPGPPHLARHWPARPGARLAGPLTDSWLAVDAAGMVRAWCRFGHYRGGQGRVLDALAHDPQAPREVTDLLLATALRFYRAAGLAEASLTSAPRRPGRHLERLLGPRHHPASTFAGRWQPRWLVTPAAWQRPGVLAALHGPGDL